MYWIRACLDVWTCNKPVPFPRGPPALCRSPLAGCWLLACLGCRLLPVDPIGKGQDPWVYQETKWNSGEFQARIIPKPREILERKEKCSTRSWSSFRGLEQTCSIIFSVLSAAGSNQCIEKTRSMHPRGSRWAGKPWLPKNPSVNSKSLL